MTQSAVTPLAECGNLPHRSMQLHKSSKPSFKASSPRANQPCRSAQKNTTNFKNPSTTASACKASVPAREPGTAVIDGQNQVDHMSKVFTFLYTLNKNMLHKLCKQWKCKCSGNKLDLLYRVTRYAKRLNRAGKDTTALLNAALQQNRFSKWLHDSEATMSAWKTTPSDEVMVQHLKQVGDKISVGGTVTVAKRDPNFTNSEFARLLQIMRDYQRTRRTSFPFSKPPFVPLSDSSGRKDSYWKTIANRFNNPAYPVRFDFCRTIGSIDPSKPPLCKRSVTVLNDHWQNALPNFIRSHFEWNATQEHPERFIDFLRKNADGTFGADSQHALIMFACLRQGRPHGNDVLLQTATQVMIGGGVEAGITR